MSFLQSASVLLKYIFLVWDWTEASLIYIIEMILPSWNILSETFSSMQSLFFLWQKMEQGNLTFQVFYVAVNNPRLDKPNWRLAPLYVYLLWFTKK